MEGPALSGLVAYKFLRPEGVGPFSEYRWPLPVGAEPGEWVVAATRRVLCREGVHACERRHLPRWIWEELWEIELDGEIERGRHKLRAPRGRLLRPVEAWSAQSAGEFARACATRAAEHACASAAELAAAMAADGDTRAGAAEETDDPYVAAHGAAVSAYIAAMTALRIGGIERHEAEREWQVEWLARALDLRV